MCALSLRNISVSGKYFPAKRLLTSFRTLSANAPESQLQHSSDSQVQKINNQSWSEKKLSEIDDKYKLFKPGMTVIDCGAACGSWTKVAVERTNARRQEENKPQGKVIAFDVSPFPPVSGCIDFQYLDVKRPPTLLKMKEFLGGQNVDLVMSELLSHNTSIQEISRERMTVRARVSFEFAIKILPEGGAFFCKIWNSALLNQFKADVRGCFTSLEAIIPESHKYIEPFFLLAKGFKGINLVIDNKGYKEGYYKILNIKDAFKPYVKKDTIKH